MGAKSSSRLKYVHNPYSIDPIQSYQSIPMPQLLFSHLLFMVTFFNFFLSIYLLIHSYMDHIPSSNIPSITVISLWFPRARRSTGHFSSAVSALLEEEDDQAMYQADPSGEEQAYGNDDTSNQGIQMTNTAITGSQQSVSSQIWYLAGQ